MSRPDPVPEAPPAPVRADRPVDHPGAERAARLARLRAGLPPVLPTPIPVAVPAPIPTAGPGGFAEAPSDFRPRDRASAPVPKPAEVPPAAFAVPDTGPEDAGPAGSRRPEAGLGRLPGIGPGLIWALGRAGVADLAALATAESEALAARLGPVGRLAPLRAWIAFARDAREG